MASTTEVPVLFPASAGPPEGVVVIYARCRVQEREGYRVVSVSGLPLAHFAAGDGAAEVSIGLRSGFVTRCGGRS